MRGRFENKGLPTCRSWQVTPQAGDAACSGRSSATNAWNVNTSTGNRNNNNTNNRYRVAGSSELIEKREEWMAAEMGAYKHKHHNFDAARFHWHIPELYDVARNVNSGNYRPKPMTAFVLTYPVYREAFAPNHADCIVDHFTAPLFVGIAEGVHTENGDISHGNRIGHSAQGMAERIRDDARSMSNGYADEIVILHRDISSFFMSINREKACDLVRRLSAKYYTAADRESKLAILETSIMNDPLENVVRKSPVGAWKHIPPHKTFFNGRPGYGLPIGKYTSQVIAGIYLSVVDKEFRHHPVLVQHFVDDYTIMARSKQEAIAAAESAGDILAGLELKWHPRKTGIQPGHRGVKTCGRVIKSQRIYIANRTVRACRRVIRSLPSTKDGALAVCKSINSYFGLMLHCCAWNIQSSIADEAIRKFGRWIYFRIEPNHYVCMVKKEYTPLNGAETEILVLLKSYGNDTWKNRERRHHPRKRGGRARNRRKETLGSRSAC